MGADTHNPLRDSALAYAARGLQVFPLSPRSKKPLPGSRGLLDATTDTDRIERWWADNPQSNIGIATGPSGLVVLDPDGQAGAAELRRLVGIRGPLPRTLASRTANGLHLVYRGAGVRSTACGDLHVRGEGGYIAAPPSIHPSGHVYAWVDPLAPIADLPDWVRTWRASLGGGPGDSLDLGAAPDFLVNLPARPVNFGEPWSAHDEQRIRAALKAIPADNYEVWCRIGMALHSLQWDRSDGTSISRNIWDQWAQKCGEKYSDHAQDFHWQSFRRSGIGIGSIFHLAQEHGWDGRVESDVIVVNPFQPQSNPPGDDPPTTGPFAAPSWLPASPNGHDAEPPFVDRDRAGRPTATCRNARAAIEALGIACRYDLFHNKMTVGGHHLQRYAGELVDAAVHVIRVTIEHSFRFDPTAVHVRDACEQLALANAHDPVVDYLAGVEWDGRERAGQWLTTYAGAADTPLHRETGRLFLRAAVRRAREPGCKWDHVVVLEGAENSGKSMVFEVLAGAENFSDQTILGRTDERQQEALEGIWIYEIAELHGMRRAEVEHVKAFVTRTRDRARPAYGHYREDRPRRCVFAGTTNGDEYLKSETGNRRFLPVPTGRIDIDRLREDRDQLWAEAVAIEDRDHAVGGRAGRLELVNGLGEQAAAAQRERLEADPWETPVGAWLRQKDDVSADDVLRDCLHLQHREQDRAIRARVGAVLKRLGWEKYRLREGLELSWRFRPSG